jgi:hypothetical protein
MERLWVRRPGHGCSPYCLGKAPYHPLRSKLLDRSLLLAGVLLGAEWLESKAAFNADRGDARTKCGCLDNIGEPPDMFSRGETN